MFERILNDALLRAPKRTGPGGYYSKEGDCVFVFISDEPYIRDRVDGLLTMYRCRADQERVIGFQVKDYGKLGLPAVNFQSTEKGGEQHVKAVTLLLKSMELGYSADAADEEQDIRRSAYEDTILAVGRQTITL